MKYILQFFHWMFGIKPKSKVRSFDIRTGLPVKEKISFPLAPETKKALEEISTAKIKTLGFRSQQLTGKVIQFQGDGN